MFRVCWFWPVLVAAAFGATARADDAEVKKTVAGLVERLQAATVKGDGAAVIDLTHPKVVEQLGGREEAIAATKRVVQELKDKGISFKSFKAGEPSDPIKGEKELFILVTTKAELKATKATVVTTSYLLGVSTDAGKTWKFVDGSTGSAEIRKMFPNLPEKLVLPKPEFKLIKD